MGMRFLSMRTTVGFDSASQELPSVSAADYNLRLGAVTPSITFDRRDNFFTPTSGWYVDLSVPVYRQSLGSDRDFETLNLTALYYRPLAGRSISACAPPVRTARTKRRSSYVRSSSPGRASAALSR
jgi:outer membrane protein assembly factor BamA